MKKLFLLIAATFAATILNAQITGRISDGNGKPVAFANVVAKAAADSSVIEGTVSGEDGHFILPKAGHGNILEVSLLGYSKYSVVIASYDISITLKEDTEFLEGAKVTVALPTHTVKAASVITTVSGSVMSRLGTANDVIEQIPGIRKEDGKFTVFGKGTPLIYINGRKIYDSSELDRLRSEDIASVELNTNPGSRYDAEVKSVLIIRTVRKAGDGLSGNLRSTFRQGRYSAFQDGADLNWRKGGLDIFGSLEANFSHIHQKQSNRVTTTTPSSVWNQNSDLSISNKGRQYYSTIGFDYAFGNGNSLGLKFQRSDLPYSNSQWPTSQEVLKDGIFQEAIDYDILWNVKRNYADGVNAYFQGKAGGFSIDFNNDFYDSRSKRTQDIHERGATDETVGNESDVYNMMLASKLVVGHNIGKAKIEGGYEYVRTSRSDAYTSTKSGLAQTDNQIRQNLAAGFLSLSIPWGKTSLDAGVRYEHSAQNYYEYGTLVPEQSRKYSSLFPTVDFTFPVAKANFSLSYSAKTKRPSYSQLNSAVQYDDRYTYEQGNPHLQPETNHDITFAGIFKWIYFSASYQYVKDAIAGWIVPYEEDSPINLMTSVNYDHLSKYSAFLSFSPKFGLWSPRLRLSLMGQDFDIEHNGSVLRMNSPLLFSSLYNTFNLGNGFLLNADVTHHTAGDMDVVTLKSSWQINLGASKNLRNWDIQLQFTDIFKTANNSMFTYGSQMVLDKWNYSDSRAIKITLRYRFNSTSSNYKGLSAGSSERNRF